jgi:Lon protease-like protein
MMNGNLPGDGEPADLEVVPLFPLPNLVLFPNALLPLHVFEERYKVMTADALAGSRLIAMALLSPGWESFQHGRPPIEPVVCVGTIISFERLDDGRYNFLLRGEMRARIDRELRKPAAGSAARPYRVARLERLRESEMMEIDLSDERRRLEALLVDGWPAKFPLVGQIRSLLRGAMRTANIADLVAFHLLDDVNLKQSILADGDIRRRVNRLLAALHGPDLPMSEPILDDVAGPLDPSRN